MGAHGRDRADDVMSAAELQAERDRLAAVAADLEVRAAEVRAREDAIIRAVSHEFRTPLSIVRGVVKSLVRPDLDSQHRATLIDALDRNANRLEDLISTLLGAAEAPEDARERILRLDRTAQELRSALTSLGADRRLDVEVDDDAKHLVTLDGPFQLALKCLVENGLKYSDAEVRVHARRVEHEIVIDVRDHGPGLPADLVGGRPRPFWQADQSSRRRHGGLGMGLFTADRLTTRLGGALELTSDDDGAHVTIHLPQRRDSDVPGPSMRARPRRYMAAETDAPNLWSVD